MGMIEEYEAMVADVRARAAQDVRRRYERQVRGGCPCGEVAGEALCPLCDNPAIPEGMREAMASVRARAARGAVEDLGERLARAMAKVSVIEEYEA